MHNTMEKRLNRKTDTFIREFKDNIKRKMTELHLLENKSATDLLQFVYDYPELKITKKKTGKKQCSF